MVTIERDVLVVHRLEEFQEGSATGTPIIFVGYAPYRVNVF